MNTEFSSPEELLKTPNDKECPYCTESTLATTQHLQLVHGKFAVHFTDDESDRFCIPCRCSAKKLSRSHWHCPKCSTVIQRKHNFERHIRQHGLHPQPQKSHKELIGTKRKAETSETTVPRTEADKPHQCPTCQSAFSSAAALRKHEVLKHLKTTEPVFLVDEERGIFVTAQHKTGPRTITHICHSFNKQAIDCEADGCREYMAMASGRECYHLKRAHSFKPHKQPPVLQINTLDDMLSKGLISLKRIDDCLQLNQKATEDRAPCIYPIFYEEHGYSGHYVNFSVYTGKKDNWCIFGRTRVILDTSTGHWVCRCKGTKKYRCVHIFAAMWWVFQEKRDLLTEGTHHATSDSEDDILDSDPETGHPQTKPSLSSEKIQKIVEYMCTYKRIPSPLPEHLTKPPDNIPTKFSPNETQCPHCPGPTPPDLEEELVTKHGTIYGVLAVHKGIYIYRKTCPTCKTPVRFQDYSSGFHNFDNKVFLTLQLCSFLTNLFKTHTAIGRFLSAMEEQLNICIHHNTIRRAFFHYSALTEYSYEYFCYRCGHHPPVTISDGNWKVSFEVPVTVLKRPDTRQAKEEDLSVNIRTKWDRLEKEIIAAGLCDDLKCQNPYSEQLSVSNFAPWIGPQSRIGDWVPKTEILKGINSKPPKNTQSQPQKVSSMGEEELIRIMECKKPTKTELIKVCSELGLSTEGSETDLLNSLSEMLLYKDLYPKMFTKLQRTGGGVLHMGCTHSVIYYCSSLLWQESARDHTDGLLSFAHPPTVYISDVAGRVARHTNNRTNQKFFQPHDGRLCDKTEENIKAAKEKTLCVDRPWMKNLSYKQKHNVFQWSKDNADDRFTTPHPITGTSERYSLYDRFHQSNQTRPEEALRSLNLAPGLASIINSSSAEQVNRDLSHDRYFLCQLKETHFMFGLRLVFHLHNESINRKFLANMKKQTDDAMVVGKTGRLVFAGTEEMETTAVPMSLPPSNGEKEMGEIEGKLSPGRGFALLQFTIKKEDKDQLLAILEDETVNVIVQMDQAFVYQDDLTSLCPKALLQDKPVLSCPWLTDDVVNARLVQMAVNAENTIVLQTYHFICWWRNFQAAQSIDSRHLTMLQDLTEDSKVLFPRVVGHQTPETGNHFILWVFDGFGKEIRVYDSLALYKNIAPQDLEVLRKAFQPTWELKDWAVIYPDQWKQDDGVNCGVFVCTGAEMEIRGTQMNNDVLSVGQLAHLRIYHAAKLIAGSKERKVVDVCLAEGINACIFKDGSKRGAKTRRLYPEVGNVEWVKCEACYGWLHKECAQFNPAAEAIFTCGCDVPENFEFNRTMTCLEEKGVKGLISPERLKELKELLESGKRKSNRMVAWQNPGKYSSLKQSLKTRFTALNEQHTLQLLDYVKDTLALDYNIIANLDLVIEVMVPEVTVDFLMRLEGICRFKAEKTMIQRIPKEKDEH